MTLIEYPPMPTPQLAPSSVQAVLLKAALVIANEAVIECIECDAVRVDLGDGLRWYDTRPMFDRREHSDECIALMAKRLEYAEAAGLVTRTGDQDWLVCLANR